MLWGVCGGQVGVSCAVRTDRVADQIGAGYGVRPTSTPRASRYHHTSGANIHAEPIPPQGITPMCCPDLSWCADFTTGDLAELRNPEFGQG